MFQILHYKTVKILGTRYLPANCQSYFKMSMFDLDDEDLSESQEDPSLLKPTLPEPEADEDDFSDSDEFAEAVAASEAVSGIYIFHFNPPPLP